ncbi:Pc22g16640 [Talaromyces islandicus]|uniref:Pc22g16640 n=1 Tax=Talaromyces islandicus TaxID=28573 RepID=A0A0U1LL98_TALIS|nr:Pc22g16640 [Talaromyces islandicus]
MRLILRIPHIAGESQGDAADFDVSAVGTWSKRCTRIRKPPVLKLDDDFTGVPLEEYVGRWIWLNTTCDDFTGEDNGWNLDSANDTLLQIDGITVKSGRFIHDLANNNYLERRHLGSPFGHYTYREGYLLDYFIHGIGPSCSLSRSNNPYMSLVPLLSHTTLRNTILAVSANQLFLLGNTVCSQEDFMYKDRALKGLQKEIKSSTLEFGTVASILMMCFHDITDGTDGCASSWLFHLRIGMQMTRQLPAYSAQAESLKRFFNMYFVAHDIMSRTGRTHCEDQWDDDVPSHVWLENDNLDEIDNTIGCSRRLMSLISQISALTRKKSKMFSKAESDLISSCEDIEIALESLQQTCPAHSSPTDSYILQIAEIKRLTALLYFNENLGEFVSPLPPLHRSMSSPPSSTSSSLSSSPLNSSSSHSIPSPKGTKQRLVSSIIEGISALPNPDTASVLWPLYVIGHSTALEDESQRRFVLERLHNIQQTRNLGSVRAAKTTVERTFRTRDLELPGSKGGQQGKWVVSLA